MFDMLWVDITDRCNYQCAFCRGNYKNKSIPMIPSDDEFKQICLKLKYLDLLNMTPQLRISNTLRLSGGEPTLYDLNAMLPYMKSFDSIEVITNLSMDYNYYNALSKKFHIVASLHEDYCNVEDFIKKANLLSCSVIITIADKSYVFYKDLISKFQHRSKLIIVPVCIKDHEGNDKISSIVNLDNLKLMHGNSTNDLNHAIRVWTNNKFNLIENGKQIFKDGFIYDNIFIDCLKNENA